MSTKLPASLPLPIAPTESEWRAMSLAAREEFLIRVNDSLSDPRAAMSEGRPHKRAKSRALDLLGLHFGALGRVVYLAEEMAVHYPAEEVFTPDVLAVVDVPQPEDDERLAWVVADEGKGLDLVLEVLHRGDRKKDLVDNVERYARLGIPEYFVYDRAQQRIRGHRLAGSGPRRYQPIVPQGGRYSSLVLGVDLAVEGGTLRFFHGMSELFGSADLIRRLTDIVQDREAKAEQAETKAQEAETKAQEAETKAQEAKAEAREAKARAEEAAAQAQQAISGLRAGVLAAFEVRGAPLGGDLRARVLAEGDVATLQRWLLQALSAVPPEQALAE